MAVLEICKEGDPVLRQRAKPVERVTKRIQRLIKDMADTMYAAKGIGLAAPQVGVSERIFVADVGEGLIAVINPQIVQATGSEVDVEGCLSMPGLQGYVERAGAVEITGMDERGKPLRIEATGLLARVFQHEIDHLDGILFTDKATGLHYVTEDPDDRAESSGTAGPKETYQSPEGNAGAESVAEMRRR